MDNSLDLQSTLTRFHKVRAKTLDLVKDLDVEDMVVQPKQICKSNKMAFSIQLGSLKILLLKNILKILKILMTNLIIYLILIIMVLGTLIRKKKGD